MYLLDFDEIEYNGKYGTLYIECEPVFTNETFSAHGISGKLESFGQDNQITDYKILSCYLVETDNSGFEVNEIKINDFEEFNYLDAIIIQELTSLQEMAS